jgi:hypothetical protein
VDPGLSCLQLFDFLAADSAAISKFSNRSLFDDIQSAVGDALNGAVRRLEKLGAIIVPTAIPGIDGIIGLVATDRLSRSGSISPGELPLRKQTCMAKTFGFCSRQVS